MQVDGCVELLSETGELMGSAIWVYDDRRRKTIVINTLVVIAAGKAASLRLLDAEGTLLGVSSVGLQGSRASVKLDEVDMRAHGTVHWDSARLIGTQG